MAWSVKMTFLLSAAICANSLFAIASVILNATTLLLVGVLFPFMGRILTYRIYRSSAPPFMQKRTEPQSIYGLCHQLNDELLLTLKSSFTTMRSNHPYWSQP
jgi:hypothetical protein